jgi:hypothetical protein
MMKARVTETGTLWVPRRAEGPNGLIGDGMVEIGPDDPEYGEWVAELAQQPGQGGTGLALAVELATDPSEWVAFRGARGGVGWKNTRTGRVVYQTPPAPPEDPSEGPVIS